MNLLLVPIRIDALVLDKDQAVVGPLVDFAKMPFVTPRTMKDWDNRSLEVGVEVNGSRPFLSGELLTEPLADASLTLKRGVHLHWSLPAMLTQALPKPHGAPAGPDVYPRIPSHWLVVRRRARPDGSMGPIEKQWEITSDFWTTDPAGGGVPFPLPASGGRGLRTVYLGRSVEAGAPPPTPAPGVETGVLDRLTAIGHGDPTFAAFYPNCRTSLGHHDPHELGAAGTIYQVIGLHAKLDPDSFGARVRAAIANGQTGKELADQVAKEFGLEVDGTGLSRAPFRVVYHGTIRFQGAGAEQPVPATKCTVALANTGGEAMSCLLAKQLASRVANKKWSATEFERRLEALRLAPALQAHGADVADKFDELRHREGFAPLNGGHLWGFSEEAGITLGASGRAGSGKRVHDLPADFATRLHELNLAQTRLDAIDEKVHHLRTRLYTDWCKYMSCAYAQPAEATLVPNIDDAKEFVEEIVLPRLEHAIHEAKKTSQEVDGLRRDLEKAIFAWERRGCLVDQSLLAPESSNSLAVAARAEDATVGDYLDFRQHGSLSAPMRGDGPRLTMMAWVKFAGSCFTCSFAEARGSAGRMTFRALRAPRLGKQIEVDVAVAPAEGGPTRTSSARARVDVEQWRHVTAVLADGTLRLFVDGERVDDAPFPDAVEAPPNPPPSFLGGLAHFRVFGDAMDVGAIRRNMTETRATVVRRPGPRFWQPREPVVLVTGEKVTHSDRHGQADLTPTRFVPWNEAESFVPLFDHPAIQPIGLKNPDERRRFGVTDWAQTPWHPLLLEWQVGLRTMLQGDGSRFAPEFLTGGAAGYAFVDGLELVPRGTPNPTVHVFNGRSLLTPHADKRFRHLLEGALAKAPELTSKVLPAFNRSRASAPALDTPASLTKHDWKTLSAWYVAQPAGLASDEVDLLLHAHAELKRLPALSQTLDGFNQALLMHRQGYQLPISDPLGFPAYQAFTARVAEALGGATRAVPVPESAFVPIRNGAIEIKKLRLVDTFGRVNDIVASGAAIHPSTWTENNGFHLPPRFVQPLMLDLRWLSARHEGRLSDDHPGTGPICGWLLANALDVSIAVYDADGRACGAIAQTEDQSGRRSLVWAPAPGGASLGNKPLPEAADVPSVALLRVVLKIMTEHGPGANAPPPGAKTEFEELLEDLDVIAENIDPENFEQHQSTALLFGRPFAVVRARVQLRMFGKPAENQSWKAFEKIVSAHWTGTEDDPEHVAAHSAGVRHVKAPVLVGDHNQVNDGVVGYWLESGTSLGDFIACLPEDEAVGAGGRPPAFTVALADEPRRERAAVDRRVASEDAAVGPVGNGRRRGVDRAASLRRDAFGSRAEGPGAHVGHSPQRVELRRCGRDVGVRAFASS